MIPVHNNLVFKPENFNTSSEPGVTIILRNQEFLTSKASEILLFEDEDLTWTEDSLYTVDNPNHSLTLKELDAMFNYMEQLLWNLEIGIEVLEYTLQP